MALIVLIVVVIVHLLLDLVYRPIAFINEIEDWGIKESFTQITSVIGISVLMLLLEKEGAWDGKQGKILLVVIPVFAMIIYEFIQIFLPYSMFDFQDLVFTLIGGIFVWIIQLIIDRS